MMHEQPQANFAENDTTNNSNEPQTETSSETETAPPKRKCPWGKIIIATILIGIVIFVIIDSLTNKKISTGFQQFLTWIESNLVAGVFAFMGVYFIATVCFVPGSLLTLGSGFVFGSAVGVGYGVVLASLSVFVGATLGSIVAFLLGRYLMRDCVRTSWSHYRTMDSRSSSCFVCRPLYLSTQSITSLV